jgi:hypothetical protein
MVATTTTVERTQDELARNCRCSAARSATAPPKRAAAQWAMREARRLTGLMRYEKLLLHTQT